MYLTSKKFDPPFDDKDLFSMYAGHGLQMYIMARISFKNHSWVPNILLMEQSVELYIKAFLLFHHKKKTWNDKSGHQLMTRIENDKNSILFFKTILQNKGYTDLIKALEHAYTGVRYAEHHYAIKLSEFQTYDALMLEFISNFYHFTNEIRGVNIGHVQQEFLDIFLDGIQPNVEKLIRVKNIIQVIFK